MKLKIGKTQGILEKKSILLNKVKEFSLKLKDFDKNSTKFLKKLKLFPQKLKVLPSRLGFYCRKTSKKKACSSLYSGLYDVIFSPVGVDLSQDDEYPLKAICKKVSI